MPRDSQGSYTLPNGTLVNTGDTILASQHNPPMQDLAQAISSSLDRDGKGGMRAAMNMGGFPIENVAPGVAPTDVATVSQLESAGDSTPLGVVLDFWGTVPPSGYLFAAGQEVSRSTYAALFAVIGTSAGAGNGSTTFNLPDYRGRISAGREAMATPASTRLNTLSSSTLGAVGGEQTHTLTEAQMPAHNHSVTDPGHSHSVLVSSGTAAFGEGPVTTNTNGQTGTATTGISIASKGGGAAHNNVQPTIICNKIMRAI